MDGTSPEFDFWQEHTQISLQAVAAPSVLGLFGFSAATFIVAANLAGWYGSTATPAYLFPLAALFGGLAQFLAGMWAYRARDALATAMHGTWGSFWLAYGLLHLLMATGTLAAPASSVAMGYWFFALAAITWSGAVAAVAENLGFCAVLVALAAGSTCEAVGMGIGLSTWSTVGDWLLIVSAVLAWYVATAMLTEATFKRVILPVGRVGGVSRPGDPSLRPIQYAGGDPGVRRGQ